MVVLAVWVALFIADRNLVPVKIWLALFWLWFVWPAALLLSPGHSFRQAAMPIAVGAAILAPCVSVIYTFSVWAIQGFAP